jgi:hypothetical protein
MQILSTSHPVVAASMASTITGAAVDTGPYSSTSVQAAWTGTPTGTLKIQIADDDAASVWTDYTGSSVSLTGTADTCAWFFSTASRWVRVVYTFTSGTGTLNVYVSQKAS